MTLATVEGGHGALAAARGDSRVGQDVSRGRRVPRTVGSKHAGRGQASGGDGRDGVRREQRWGRRHRTGRVWPPPECGWEGPATGGRTVAARDAWSCVPSERPAGKTDSEAEEVTEGTAGPRAPGTGRGACAGSAGGRALVTSERVTGALAAVSSLASDFLPHPEAASAVCHVRLAPAPGPLHPLPGRGAPHVPVHTGLCCPGDRGSRRLPQSGRGSQSCLHPLGFPATGCLPRPSHAAGWGGAEWRGPRGSGGRWFPERGTRAGDGQRTRGRETSVGSGIRSQRQIRERTQEG